MKYLKQQKKRNKPNSILFEMNDCGGCRTCELACGFHHTGSFDPNLSSLKILDLENDSKSRKIEIRLNDDEFGFGCDGCINLNQELCVVYCENDEELLEMIKTIQEYKKEFN